MEAQLDAVLATIEQAGFPAYLVGGCVRDYLRTGLMHRDIDIATAAPPSIILQLFHLPLSSQDSFTMQFGTIRFEQGPYQLEITTMRQEQGYRDQRHPTNIQFVTKPALDAPRRDFTINALYLARDGTILDYFDGQADLEAGRLRCIGDPELRMHEDPLRLLRALRFMDTLSLTLDPALALVMVRDGPTLLTKVSPWRFQKELDKWRAFRSNRHIKAIFHQHQLPYPPQQRSVSR
ncbi:MAG: hypothetical protein WCS53_00195 [Bacilli bacterium]|jgi:tRNA nucleotidyltransferase (CCA-adding enzyme)